MFIEKWIYINRTALEVLDSFFRFIFQWTNLFNIYIEYSVHTLHHTCNYQKSAQIKYENIIPWIGEILTNTVWRHIFSSLSESMLLFNETVKLYVLNYCLHIYGQLYSYVCNKRIIFSSKSGFHFIQVILPPKKSAYISSNIIKYWRLVNSHWYIWMMQKAITYLKHAFN